MPYFPLWLKEHSFTAAQIGLITGLPLILRGPIIFALGVSADAIGDRRLCVIALSAISMLLSTTLLWSDQFWLILIATATLAVSFGAILPVSDAITLAGPQRTRDSYGRIRLWGSLSFIAANLACGYAIKLAGAQAFPIWALCALGLMLVLSLQLPRARFQTGSLTSALREHGRDAVRLLMTPAFAFMVVIYGLIQASHGIYYVFSVIHWQSIGYDTTWIGGLWAVGVIAEIALFAGSRRLILRFSALGLFLIGGTSGILRWCLSATDPPLSILVMLQASHALTFAATHIGGMAFISRAVPTRLAATAQGLLHAAGAGLFAGLVFLSTGPLYNQYGAYSYFAMAVLCGCALVLLWFMARIWNGSALPNLAQGKNNVSPI